MQKVGYSFVKTDINGTLMLVLRSLASVSAKINTDRKQHEVYSHLSREHKDPRDLHSPNEGLPELMLSVSEGET